MDANSGLLGLLGVSSGDAQKDAALNHGLLQAGLTLLQSRGRLGPALGQAGMAGLQGMQQYGQAQFQQTLQKSQLDELKRKQDMQQRADAFRDSLVSPQMQASQGALAGGGGPTMANAQKMPAADPSGDMLFGAMKAGLIDPAAYISSIKKDTTPIPVKEGEVLLDPHTRKPIFSNPKSNAEKTPEALRALAQIYGEGSPEYLKASREYANKLTTHQPPPQVNVNTGKEGIANELKMRDDFRSEPIYKAHQEVRSAYSQIQQGLKLQSPAGDLAAATKIMKLLDPGSVVRESELGMAMAATGLLDRVSGYATNILKGTKLTPAQRKDFQTLADALYGESAKQFNSKQGEYQTFAKDWGLNGGRITGPGAAPPQGNVVDFGSLK